MTYARGCTGKYKYATRDLAEKVASDWIHRTRGAVHPYLCKTCGSWHLSRLTENEAARAHRLADERSAANAALVQRLLKERGLR